MRGVLSNLKDPSVTDEQRLENIVDGPAVSAAGNSSVEERS